MNWSYPAYVYGLRLDDGDIFYVGSARNLASRYKSHVSYKEDAKYPYQQHIRRGLAEGKTLHMDRLETSNVNDVREREAYWIWRLSDQVFNRVLPSWGVLSIEEGQEIDDLEDTIAKCKARIVELRQLAWDRSQKVNRSLREAAKTKAERENRLENPPKNPTKSTPAK